MADEPRDDDEAEAKARSALKEALHKTATLKELRVQLGKVAPGTKAGGKAKLLQQLSSGLPPDRVPRANALTIDGVALTLALRAALERIRDCGTDPDPSRLEEVLKGLGSS